MSDIQTQLPVKLTDNTNTAGITTASALQVDVSMTMANATAILVTGTGGTFPVTGTVAIVSEKAEDSGHTTGDTGTFILAVRNDADAVLTSADMDYSPISVDSTGKVKISGTLSSGSEKTEDSGHTTGDTGTFVLAVRNDADAVLTSTDMDYSPFAVDSAGRVKTVSTASYAEDSGHTTGDTGTFVLAVRNDADAVLTSTDLDYSPISVDSTGKMKVSGTFSSNSEYAEDSAHSSGATGTFVLAVRNDADAALTSADMDYSPFAVDSAGKVKTTSGAEYAEDSGHTTADTGVFILGVRNDADAVLTSADMDYTPISVDSTGKMKVSGTFSSSSEYAEDSGHTTGDTGTFILAVRNDADAVLTSADMDYSPFAVDDTGRVKITAPAEVTSGAIAFFDTVTSVASASTGTITYTVTAGTTFLFKQAIASASGGPCKVIVDYGAGPTTIAVGFFSTASPVIDFTFAQPIPISAGTAVNVKIENQTGLSMDIYGALFGAEI